MTDTYKIGDFIVITNDFIEKQYEIIGVEDGFIRLLDCISLVQSSCKYREISELILRGTASVIPKSKYNRELTHPLALDFSGYPDDEKKEAKRRFIYVKSILDANVHGFTEKNLFPIVKKIAVKLGENSPPNIRTINRWIRSYIASGESIKGLLPKNRNKGNRKPRFDERVMSYFNQAVNHYKKNEMPSVSSSYDYFKTLIEYDNICLDENIKISLPSITTFTQWLHKQAPYELTKARLGNLEAHKKFKQTKNTPSVELILQRAEIDHTQLDLFVVDHEHKGVLGRPWITALLDYKSKCILGFEIGFEPPSYLSVARTLKHAMSSKDYVKEKYPSVQNDWPCFGKPAVIVTDRGKEFISDALEDACFDLGIIIQHNPGKHPWYKGSIERFFGTHNQKLLDDKVGKVEPRFSALVGYNPEKNGIISFDIFLEIFHIWIVDIYHQESTSSKKIIPIDVWYKDIESVPIAPINASRLDIALSESHIVNVTTIGIKRDYIVYDNESLTRYRMKHGFGKVKIKTNKCNLGYLYVFDEFIDKYFKVEAVDKSYADGLTNYQHQIHKKFSKKYISEKINMNAITIAKMQVIELIKNEIFNGKNNSMKIKQRTSRYLNVSNESIIRNAENAIIGNEKYPKNDEISHSVRDVHEIFDGEGNDLPEQLDF